MPGCAILAFCPGSFIQCTSSARVLGGNVGRATRMVAALLMSPIVTKSFSASTPSAVKRHARRQRNLVQQERIPVGRGARCVARGNHPPGSADVLDDDLLAERLRHAVLNDARDRIG